LRPVPGNERISARVQEIVGRAAERAEVSLERILRELAAIAFSNISKAVTWGPSVQVREEEEDGQRVKIDASGRGTGDGELRGDNPDLRSAAEADDVSYFSDQNGLALIPT